MRQIVVKLSARGPIYRTSSARISTSILPNSAVALSFHVILGRGGWATTWRLGPFRVWVAGSALIKSMTSYERSPDYVVLKPTWKGNLGWLFLVAMIASASIFVFAIK